MADRRGSVRTRLLFAAAALILLLYIANVVYLAADRQWRPPAGAPIERTDEWIGAVHVHTLYSDGSGTIESVSRAAAAADCDFLIVTDHNTEEGLHEAGYRNGVLVVVGEERSANGGHLLIIGAPGIEGDDPESICEEADVRGGFTVVAHPFGRRSWEVPVPSRVNGYEIINSDSEWRDDSIIRLLSSLVALPVLPHAPWNRLASRHDANLTVFDSLLAVRRVTPIASVDAHAALEFIGESLIPFPGYRVLFESVRTHVLLSAPPTGDAGRDTRALLSDLRAGRVFLAYDGLGTSAGFRFEGRAPGEEAVGGGSIAADGAKISVELPLPGPTVIRIFRNGALWKEGAGPRLEGTAGRGIYRAEIFQKRRYLRPWIITSTIRVGDGLAGGE